MNNTGAGQGAVTKDSDVMPVFPITMIVHSAIHNRVSRDVVIFVRVNRECDANVMNSRHEGERFPRSFTRCRLARLDEVDAGVVDVR